MNPPEEEIEYLRSTSTPRNIHKKPRPPYIRESKFIRFLTYGVLLFAVAWEAGVVLFHLHPSELTFTGFLAVLIFYTGEFLDWKRPRIPKLRQRRAPWRDR